MATKQAELYDEDFYAWTQAQAKALRTHFRGDNRLDVEHLAEEVEDLGSSELQAIESFVEQIIAQLLKLDYSGQDAPRPHWRAEVLNFRRSAGRKISPTIRRTWRASSSSYTRVGGRSRRSARCLTSLISPGACRGRVLTVAT
jgi:hypothetical protein